MTIRHGDLLIIQVDSIPDGLPKKENTILLEGESTNHFHRLRGGTVYAERPTRDNNYLLGFFELEKDTELTHEEHKTIVLNPGKYKFLSQREWDELEERRVID
jgi:hypothetical protein